MTTDIFQLVEIEAPFPPTEETPGDHCKDKHPLHKDGTKKKKKGNTSSQERPGFPPCNF